MSRRRKSPKRKGRNSKSPTRKAPRRNNARTPGRAMRQANANLERTVRSRGWMIQYVGGPNCSINSCACQRGRNDGLTFA